MPNHAIPLPIRFDREPFFLGIGLALIRGSAGFGLRIPFEVCMRLRLWLVVMMMSLPVVLPAVASAQGHVADAAAMQDAIGDAVAVDTANRTVVLEALGRDDVKDMADRFGVDLQTARSAVGALSGVELAELAAPARALAADPSGGATTVVISVTTLLLVLILVVLLVK